MIIQTEGVPYLWFMWTTTNTVAVRWALSDISWQLQATTNLVTTGSAWMACACVTNGANCVYIESPSTDRKFYRLRGP